jgi:hypothetical protein
MIEATQKKLREAQFFFRLLQASSDEIVRNEPEAFEYYLSAFLSAARSVTFSLQAEERQRYDLWFQSWTENNLTPEDRAIWGFLKDQRNSSQKTGRVDTSSDVTFIPIHEIRSPQRQSFSWFGPPGTPPPSIGVPVYDFDIDGENKNVVDTCRRYLQGITKMVADFLRDNACA